MTSFDNILSLIDTYKSLGLTEVIDYNKFNHYAITHHSTGIEGSSLSETETRLLLDEDITPKGKPLTDSLMTKDHYSALQYVLNAAEQKVPVAEAFIKNINAQVLKSTRAIYNTALGTVDSSSGEYRLNNVRAGHRYFVNYVKVPQLVTEFCHKVQSQMEHSASIEDQLYLSFDAHFDLVSIHSFYDGNGRTARLLMNFIQSYFSLPLGIVFKEDKSEYFDALEASRKDESLSPFRTFMLNQFQKFISNEIEGFQSIKKEPNKGKGYSFVF
jgi:Fic family protein